MNHCPVYGVVSGHAYGWVYPGPIGSVLNPQLLGIEQTHLLPNACTMCGRCEEVCPVHIPLPSLLRRWRERGFDAGHPGGLQRFGLKIWAGLAKRPGLYRFAVRPALGVLRLFAGKRGADCGLRRRRKQGQRHGRDSVLEFGLCQHDPRALEEALR